MPLDQNLLARGFGIDVNAPTVPKSSSGGGGGSNIPQDYQNLWDFSTLVATSEDMTGATEITDLAGNANLAAAVAPSDVHPVAIRGAAHPDGIYGVQYATRSSSSWAHNCYWTPGIIDFNANNAFTIFGFFFAELATPESSTDNFILFGTGDTSDLKCRMRPRWNGGSPTISVELELQLNTGVVSLTHSFTYMSGIHGIGVSSDGATVELWFDGVLVDSAAPVGATNLNLTVSNEFGITGGPSAIFAAGDNAIWGSHGQYIYHYTRKLNATEMEALYTERTNTSDPVGSVFNYYSSLISENISGGVDMKTMTSGDINDGQWLLSNYAPRSTTKKFEWQVLLTGVTNDIMIGFSTDLYLNTFYLGQSANGIGWWGGGSVWWNGSSQGVAPTFGDGDLLTMQYDPSTTTFSVKLNNGSFVNFNINLFITGLSDRMYYALGQTNPWSGSAKLLTTESDMLAFGNPITPGYSVIKSAGPNL